MRVYNSNCLTAAGKGEGKPLPYQKPCFKNAKRNNNFTPSAIEEPDESQWDSPISIQSHSAVYNEPAQPVKSVCAPPVYHQQQPSARTYKQPYLSGRVYNNDSVLYASSQVPADPQKKQQAYDVKGVGKSSAPAKKPYVAPKRNYGPNKQLGVSPAELFCVAGDFPEHD